MGRRGGCRPRRYVRRDEVPVWVPSGRWGPRRVRVEECAEVLRAEIVYGQLVCDGQQFGPGRRATLLWQLHGKSGPTWTIDAEVIAERGLASRAAVSSLSALRAASYTSLRPGRGMRAPLSAVLGARLQQPILVLQAGRILRPLLRNPGVRDHRRTSPAAPKSLQAAVRSEARAALNARQRPALWPLPITGSAAQRASVTS